MIVQPRFISTLPRLLLPLLLITSACTTTRILQDTDLKKSSVAPETLIAQMPDYSHSLKTVKGKGKAIVSEPGNSERVTVNFSGNRLKSHVTIKNGIGIEGGEILSEGDSLLIYNKLDKIARKVPVREGHLSSVSHLASVNIVNMLNFTVTLDHVESVYETESNYVLMLDNGGKVYVDKKSYLVQQVDQHPRSGLPYSRIIYEAYGELEGYILPRRVTIFSMDARTKVALLIQSLEVNPGKLDLRIELPEDVKFVSQ